MYLSCKFKCLNHTIIMYKQIYINEKQSIKKHK